MREVKVEEFINLNQGNMIVEEYSLKFSKLSKYGPSLVSNPRDGAYLDNEEKFKEYSATLILSCLRLINSSTLTSLISLGKYLPRKASLYSSHSIRRESSGLCLYIVCTTLAPQLSIDTKTTPLSPKRSLP